MKKMHLYLLLSHVPVLYIVISLGELLAVALGWRGPGVYYI